MPRFSLYILIAAAWVGSACGSGDEEPAPQPEALRAYQATSPDQLIGGDVAMARVGDYIIENDKIRLGILGIDPSPGPGVFGGTLVDADLRRPDARFRNGNGRDQFAEMFPFANLLAPKPDTIDVSVLKDGSDGKEAIVRVRGEGEFFLEALSLFQSPLAKQFFPNIKMHLSLETDYILEPGKNYVKMVTTLRRTDPIPDPDSIACSSNFECDVECASGYTFDEDGCPMCECGPSDPTSLIPFEATAPVFGVALGDEEAGNEPGMVAGDFVFFGAQNDIWGPGIGYDEEKAIFETLFKGRDPFTYPLEFDFMAASGGAVSYGYFTAKPGETTQPKILVPIITSSATAFVTHGINCSTGAEDDELCDRANSWTFTRYFVVGQGDVASVADTMFKIRKTPVGTVRGVVVDAHIRPEKNGRIFIFTDPDPNREFASIYEVVDANEDAVGSTGMVNVIEADVGLDPQEDGDFEATMPPGTYLAVAVNEQQTATSSVIRFTVTEGETTVIHPVVPLPAKVVYRVRNESGALIPAKLNFVSLLEDGQEAERDGLRRPYSGQGRLGNGLRHLYKVHAGEGSVEVEAGRYRLTVSHGTEHSVSTHEFAIASGETVVIDATVKREVDTTGWISGDFHLHAEPSFDSGMKLEKRLLTIVAEGLELAVSTDHDVVTDYAPTVRKLSLEPYVKTAIGVEVSTLELGHFIAFPLAYDDLKKPDHGAPDWACKDGPGIVAELEAHIEASKDGVKIMAHPRDGFIGYISQLGVNPFNMTRAPSFLEEGNVLLSRATCDFDAMELFNSKRFDLIRTPSNKEVILYNRCMGRIDVAQNQADLDVVCPEVSGTEPLTTCSESTRFFECQQRFRRELAFRISRDILIRTKEEQQALWAHAGDADQDERSCDPNRHPDAIDPAIADMPCVYHPGTIDDWMKWLHHGLPITVTAASDSHGAAREPGMPRTYVRSQANTPQQIIPEEAASHIRDGKAMPTYGPFVEVSVEGAIPGETVTVAPGGDLPVRVRVQTASWFGVDRIEVYVSGELQHVAELDHGPEVIVDFDEELILKAPDTDGFVNVVALGTRKENLVGPVYLDIPFGELQLPRVASLAFSSIPAFSLFLSDTPMVPDFFPIFPMAATNAVFLDADGDGVWAKKGPLPPFCPRSCTPDGEPCPPGQECLEGENICAVPIEGECRTGAPGVKFSTHATHH